MRAVEHQILIGKTYLEIAKGLQAAESVVFGVAPTFFGLTIEGAHELAQMAIARLYDRDPRTVTVNSMLRLAACAACSPPGTAKTRQTNTFERGTRQEVNEAISKCKQEVTALAPVLKSIRLRRNQWFAHLDESTVRDPAALNAAARLTIKDLDRAFADTENILRRLERLYDGTVGPIRFSGGDDYRTLLEYLHRYQTDKMNQLRKPRDH
jgi:hypothetical protein